MGSIGHQNDPIQEDLEQLLISAANYSQKQSSDLSSYDARYDLMVKTSRLLQTIRGPADVLFGQFENAANIGAVRALLEAGVFHAIPTGGKDISADEVSEKTGLDKNILLRHMRAVTPLGPFRETGEERYAHTPFSEIYLAPQMSAIYNMMVDDYLPAVLRNHEYLSQNDWKNNIGVRHNPYTMVNNCEGKTIFEHLADDPKRLTRFNEAMMAADSGLVTVGLYPFQEELGSLATDDSVTMVDVGGGRGHVIRQIKGSVPNLKGRFILQDRPPVIEDNGKEIEAHGIEAMPHDFFDPQPVKGALVYYIRRCFHDWPDEPESRQILENLAASMDREKSRVLITEFIVPEVGSTMSLAWMDQTMMAFGGVERTEKDWARLLDISGLKLVKVWRAPGVPVGVVEARLK